MAKVALISKDEALTELVSEFLMNGKHEVTIYTEYNTEAAINKSGGFDVIVIDDFILSTTSGKYHPLSSPKLIILGNLLKPPSVKKIIREGAWDCISKPIKIAETYTSSSVEDLKERMLNSIKAVDDINLQEYDIEKLDRSGIIGKSHSITSCLASLIPAIESDLSILIMGETGTGKELFAKTVHMNSTRKDKRLIPVNCATITETLAEGILFGWEKGIHNKADNKKDGLLIEAHGGTLYLDEIGDLSLENQTRLLTAIQEKVVTRLGASKTTPADFRLVAATNKYIFDLIEQGKFRADLFYRICDTIITIPPLRDRREDIKDITDYYIQSTCEKHNISPVKTYSDDFMEALQIWNWPGNIRELMTAVRSAIFIAGKAPSLNIHNLSADLRSNWVVDSLARSYDLWQSAIEKTNSEMHDLLTDGGFTKQTDEIKGVDSKGSTDSIQPNSGQTPTLDQVERKYFERLLNMVDKNKISAAEAVNISGLKKDAYYKRIEKHGLKTKK